MKVSKYAYPVALVIMFLLLIQLFIYMLKA